MRRLAGICLAWLLAAGAWGATVTVGSKNFNEGYLLAEMSAQVLEHAGFDVERRFGRHGPVEAGGQPVAHVGSDRCPFGQEAAYRLAHELCHVTLGARGAERGAGGGG